MLEILILLLAAVCILGYLAARGRTLRSAVETGVKFHSLPSYYGLFVALWTGLPALVLLLLWLLLQGPALDALILRSLPADMTRGLESGQLQLLLSEIKNVAAGRPFGTPRPAIVEAAERYAAWVETARWAMLVVILAVALGGLAVARQRIDPAFRARNAVERIVGGLMIAASLIAILTTAGIIVSLLFEALRFFERVPPHEFFFGLRWEPQIPLREDQIAGLGAFGAIPVFTGTLLIAVIAMAVAIPVGLMSAIYLAEYASERLRAAVKPLMEILAGIPTVVYGFFAILVVAPALRDAGGALSLDVAPNSALAAGAVMGIMIIPFISSLSDDALNAVPRALREGSYGLGATKAETVTKILLPAALPGIMGGILLAVSRAIGETMIVVMAAGLIATLTANPLEGVTTVTVQIVTLLIGDTEFDSPKTLAAFALGLVLFVVTLGLNVIALRIVQKYREKYE